MSELEKFVTSHEIEAGDLFAKVKVVRAQDLREFMEKLESANSALRDELREYVLLRDGDASEIGALRDEAKRHSEFMKGKVALEHDDVDNIMRLAGLTMASAKCDSDYHDSFARISKALQQSAPTPLESK